MGYIGGTEAVLDANANFVDRLGGFYCRCVLDGATRLEFASQGLCKMLGYQKDELFSITEGIFEALVHPDDRESHLAFTRRLSMAEGNSSAAYRLIAKDGAVICVHEIAVSSMGDDGVMRSTSIAFDDRTWQEVEPGICGERFSVMKVFGDRGITIACLNDYSKDLLRIDSRIDHLCLSDYIVLADRTHVGAMFDEAYAQMVPVADVCTLVSSVGAPHACKIWVECVRRKDTKKDSLFCVKAASAPDRDVEFQELLSLSKKLLASFADDLFEFDKSDNSITCIARSDGGVSSFPLNIRVFADDMIKRLLSFVSPRDKERVMGFCNCSRLAALGEDGPHTDKITFELGDAAGCTKAATLVMVSASKSKSYIGFRLEAAAGDSAVGHAPYENDHSIAVRLFGSFSLSVDGRAINIRSEKAKELLALLVERRGSFVSSREAIAMLWECEPNKTTRARYRKTASRLMIELGRNGIDYIVESDRGARRIVPECIECDYYDYRDGVGGLPTGGGAPRVCLVGVYFAIGDSFGRVKCEISAAVVTM
ncbi:PAS domain-containing protein [Collinsella aerofaciens]|uniref:PAS fold protein n=1 Tax=Collinsella aerofaciens TaxID=74426 RepID=A0A5K1J7V8_9ACTN|nr:PAS domain-containing protein [Collinsella aerofaciens]VWL99427.1 PAS fold protein [Collinsella aerofaciens]